MSIRTNSDLTEAHKLKDENKTKKQLIRELTELRQKITESLKTDPEQRGIHPSTNEYEIRYRTLFDRSLFCVYLHDLQGNLFDANETALKLFGYTKEELPSLNILSLIPEEQRPIALQRIEEILKTGSQKKPFEYMVKKKDGEYLWLEVEGALIVKNGKPYAIQGIARDITERKKADEALRASEEKYRDLVENINDVLYIVDKKGIITYISPTVKGVIGYIPSEIVGRHFTNFIFQKDLIRIEQQFLKILSGKIEPSEYRLVTKSGDIRWVRTSSHPIYEDNSVIGLRGVLSDVTVRKQTEELLKTREKELRERVKELEDFYDMAVGRELRMKQLKEENEKLKKELEKYKKL